MPAHERRLRRPLSPDPGRQGQLLVPWGTCAAGGQQMRV